MGIVLFEPARMTECRIAAMDDMHPDWPNDGMGIGGGRLSRYQGRPIFWNDPRPEQDVAFLQNRPNSEPAARVFQAEMTPGGIGRALPRMQTTCMHWEWATTS